MWEFWLEDLVEIFFLGQRIPEGRIERWESVIVTVSLILIALSATLILNLVRETRRAAADQARDGATNMFKEFLDRSPAEIVLKDADGRYVLVNRRCEEKFRLSLKDFMGKTVHDVLPPHDADVASAHEREVLLKQAVVEKVLDIPYPDGIRTNLVLKFPVKDTARAWAGIGSIAIDISERQRIEQTLRETKAQLQTAIESFADGFFLYDANDRLVLANEGHFDRFPEFRGIRFIGMSFEEFVRKIAAAGLYGNTPEKTEKVVQRRLKFYRSGKPFEYRKSDGLWYEVKEFEAGDGGIALVRSDITERKRAEEHIKASLAEKEVLLKEIHHRVRNNLQVISSMLSLQANIATDAGVLDVLRESQRRVCVMARIHDSLLHSDDLSSINAASYLNALVEDIRSSFELDPQRISLSADLDEVILDTERAIIYGKIVSELLANCAKHAFPNGQSGRIEVSFHRLGEDRIELVVADNGIGLPAGFDLEAAQTLGMRLVGALVDKLRGELTIDRSGGTRFRIVLSEHQ